MLLNKELKHNYEITIFIVILFTIIYSMINNDNKKFIAKILINDFVIFLMVVLLSSLFITYNYMMGILLTIIYIIMILPYFRGYFIKDKKEGFSSNDDDLMSIISGKGKKTKELFKKINKYKSEKKREKVLETLNIDNDREEEFNNGNSSDTALKIEKRKFNPNDEVDNNLLMTKEICNDIKNRISYNYENIEYLKKYISSRLQEIIDILDLTE